MPPSPAAGARIGLGEVALRGRFRFGAPGRLLGDPFDLGVGFGGLFGVGSTPRGPEGG